MSKPRYRWEGYVIRVIEDQPRKQAELDSLRFGRGGLDGMPRAKGARRATEDKALRTLPRDEMFEYDAVQGAVNWACSQPDGEDILHLIELRYWRRSHTIRGASRLCRMSESTALRRNQAFKRRVAQGLGLLGRRK